MVALLVNTTKDPITPGLSTFGTLYDTFPAERRVFENKNFLDGLGNTVSKRSVADEKTLEYFLHNGVEDTVRNIIEQLKEAPGVSSAFNTGNGIIFENHSHAINDTAEEVVDRETPSTPPRTPGQQPDLKRTKSTSTDPIMYICQDVP
jgi:hypothetical protein